MITIFLGYEYQKRQIYLQAAVKTFLLIFIAAIIAGVVYTRDLTVISNLLTEKISRVDRGLRLRSAAKFWYQTVQNEVFEWKTLKKRLIESFPSPVDEASIHMQLINRKRKAAEPVENYFYEVAALAKQAKLSETTTMNYIITGIGDRNLSNILTAANCGTLTEVLTRIKTYESLQKQENNRSGVRTREIYQSNAQLNQRMTQSQEKGIEIWKSKGNKFFGKCFNCGKAGHRAVECFSKKTVDI